jgi:hypothetical protein
MLLYVLLQIPLIFYIDTHIHHVNMNRLLTGKNIPFFWDATTVNTVNKYFSVVADENTQYVYSLAELHIMQFHILLCVILLFVVDPLILCIWLDHVFDRCCFCAKMGTYFAKLKRTHATVLTNFTPKCIKIGKTSKSSST